jgi:DNA-binding NarL/FixJ family response regulator
MLLIVDDNKKYISRLIELLQLAGIEKEIITANDYDEAVKKIAGAKPSIVLLDINMAGKSGMEVLHFIKRGGWYCRVVMVTNHASESYRRICLEAGADDFIDKSRDFAKIPALIEELSV